MESDEQGINNNRTDKINTNSYFEELESVHNVDECGSLIFFVLIVGHDDGVLDVVALSGIERELVKVLLGPFEEGGSSSLEGSDSFGFFLVEIAQDLFHESLEV
jgi:hypothetical protein